MSREMLLTIATDTGANMNDYVYDFEKFAGSLENVIIAVACTIVAGVLAFGYQALKNRETKKYAHLCDRRWEALKETHEIAGIPIPVVREYDSPNQLMLNEPVDERTREMLVAIQNAGDRS